MNPQVIVFLSEGKICCEAPGKNGARRKIDLPSDFAARNPELMIELNLIADEQRQETQRELQALQSRNISYVESNHPFLASKVWKNGELIFNRAWKNHYSRNKSEEVQKIDAAALGL